jgi:hypothetical protein
MSELIASLRVGVFTDVVRTHVPAESVEEQWDIRSLESNLAAEWALPCRWRRCWSDEPNLNDDDILERVLAAADESYTSKVGIVGKESFGGFERNVMLQKRRHPLARAPGGAGPPAPGHPPARLRAEEPEAGIQARSLRAVLEHAGPDQERSDPHRHDGAHPDPRRSRSGRSGDAAPQRRTWKTSTTSTPTSTRRPRRKNCWRRPPSPPAPRRCRKTRPPPTWA